MAPSKDEWSTITIDHLDNVDNAINFERMILFDYIYQTMR